MIKVHNPNKLPLIDYRKLVNLQPDSFKDLTKERFEKLSGSFNKHGFFIPYYVWIDGEHYYTVDGHQRSRVLSILEPNGLDVPYCTIQAKNKKEAAEKLLVIDSKYGKRTAEGEQEFIDTFDIDQQYIDGIIPLEFEYSQDNIGNEDEGNNKEDNDYLGRFPLSVILTAKDYGDWQNYKNHIRLRMIPKHF